MKITFINAKNGQTTAQYNGINLHSTYNPDMESKRFAESSNCNFAPAYILITEPALSYCIPYLKQKYPDSKFICIRYIPDFEKYNSNFDIVLNYYEHTQDFESYFFNYFGEEKLFSIFFLKWEASAKAFPEIDTFVWSCIKTNLQKAQTLLVTREFFEKKWFINSLNFFKNANNICLCSKTNKPVLIMASGPSLKPLLGEIASIRNHFYIICLSSAISVLKRFNIIPDLYLSTDGGYWAGQHLKSLSKNNRVPLCIPCEAFIPKSLFSINHIIPMNYGDGPSAKLFQILKTPCIKGERNGTVSGTALKLALNLSDNDIYFAGLDLSVTKSLAHTNPNEIEFNNSLKDNFISSKEKRIVGSGMNTSSLDIYKDWFCSQSFNNRNIYRIINPEDRNNELGNIVDLSICDLLKAVKNYTNTQSENLFSYSSYTNNKPTKQIIDDLFNDVSFLRQLFPLEFTSLSHSPDDEQIKAKIETKKNELYTKALRIIND